MYLWKYKKLTLRKQQQASQAIGVSSQYLSSVCAGKIAVRKVLAYCIAKYIDSEAEIEDYFERVE